MDDKAKLLKTSSAKYGKRNTIIPSEKEKNYSQNELKSLKNSLRSSMDVTEENTRECRRETKRDTRRDTNRDSRRDSRRGRESRRSRRSGETNNDSEKKEKEDSPSSISLLALASKQSHIHRLTSRNRSSTVKKERTESLTHRDAKTMMEHKDGDHSGLLRHGKKRSMSKLRLEDVDGEANEPVIATNIDEYRKMVCDLLPPSCSLSLFIILSLSLSSILLSLSFPPFFAYSDTL
jgi:hypothetical protein